MALRMPRRPRWPRAARPKRASVPREATLLSLVKAEDAWTLQNRVCGNQWGSPEVPGYSEFWTKQWPGLLREACKTPDESCLRVLLTLGRTGGMPAPELPAQFLGWLVQGLIARNATFSGLHETTQYLVYDRVRGSKMSLRKADGLAILTRRGLEGMFYQTSSNHDKTPQVRNLPTVVDAWKRWCAKADHRKAGVELVVELTLGTGFAGDGRRAFASLVEGAPEKYRAELIEDMAQKLRYLSLGGTRQAETLQRMGRWYEIYDTHGWDTSHDTWFQWGVRFTQAVSEITEPGSPVARAWADTLTYTLPDTDVAPAGWTWHAGVARGYFIGRSKDVVQILDRDGQDMWMGQNHFYALETWLGENHRVWERLVRLRLETRGGWENWKNAQTLAMGQDWEQRIDQLVARHSAHPEAKSLVETWAQWKARELAWGVGHAYTPEPAPRALRM